MTIDEIIAEFEAWLFRSETIHGERLLSLRDAYLAAAMTREKRIAELERRLVWLEECVARIKELSEMDKQRIAELEASDAYATEQWLRDNASNAAANSLLRERIAELERITDKVIHCDACGDSWYDSGICAASCPHCRLARVTEALDGLVQLVSVSAYDVLPAEAAMFLTNDGKFNAARAALVEEQEEKT
jgi:hypothetical protein